MGASCIMPPEFFSQLRCDTVPSCCCCWMSGEDWALLRWLSSAGEVGADDEDDVEDGDESPINCESQVLSASTAKGEL
jgi:hypothetical protein